MINKIKRVLRENAHSKNYKPYSLYLLNSEKIRRLEKKGFEFIHYINKPLVLLGSTIIFISLITPFTNVVLIPLGIAVLNSSGIQLFKIKNNFSKWLKMRIRSIIK